VQAKAEIAAGNLIDAIKAKHKLKGRPVIWHLDFLSQYFLQR
jgi:hypothetical protein